MKKNLKKIIFVLKNLPNKIFRLFFSFIDNGENCVVCGKKTILTPICIKCKKDYFSIDELFTQRRCSICGKKLISTIGTCIKCRENRVLFHTDSVFPLFSYRLWNKELMFRWKIQSERIISSFFAQLINQILKYLEFDAIIPIPPRKGKIKKNGWDQIEELCTILEKLYDYKVLRILERKTKKEQKKLNREERLLQIQNGYCVHKKRFSKLNKIPKKVCIIDDVCTTGATLESCAKILKENGIEKVYAVTLFIVD